MKKVLLVISSLLFLFSISCSSEKSAKAEAIVYLDTGIDANAWVKIPAGEFLKGSRSLYR